MTNVDVWFPPKMKFLFAPSRYKVAYGGRGSAKSWSIARALLLIGKQPDLLWSGWSEQYGRDGVRILCYRETMRSIEESVHQLLTDQIRLLQLGDFYRIQQKNIVGANGTEFFFAGVRQSVDNLKSYEGVHLAWGSQSEAMSKRSLNVVFPTLRRDITIGEKKYGSELWFDFNPEFEDDEIYKLFAVEANRPQDSQVTFINWHDNPFFPEVLKKEREDLLRRDPDECQHIYEGTTRSTVEGAIYKKELQRAEIDGRLTGRVPYDPTKPVNTFWDIGPAHTRIWFAQSFPMEFRIIDYVAGELESLAFYVKQLQEREYHYGVHTLPWDGAARELGSGRSIEEQLQGMFGKDRVRCAKQLSIEDGIAAVRAIFSKCYFDNERCNFILPATKQLVGLRGLRCYQYEFDKDLRTYSRKPLHDWACFTGETKVLTHFGTYRIMDLPENGEVLTPCGWKRYEGPRLTRKNAQLAAVKFSDDSTVRCTPDHLFLTVSGWKSAESLMLNTPIQSSLTRSRSISMAVYIASGQVKRTIRAAVKGCIEKCGAWRLEIFPAIPTSIIGMNTSAINFPTSNACLKMNTIASRTAEIEPSALKQGIGPQIGIALKKDDCGIGVRPNDQRAGQNGSASKSSVLTVARNSWDWFAKVILKSTVPRFANPLRVVSVTLLPEREDTYCIHVEDGHWFSLANGAVVHNSHDADAFRTLAVSIREEIKPRVKAQPSTISRGIRWG